MVLTTRPASVARAPRISDSVRASTPRVWRSAADVPSARVMTASNASDARKNAAAAFENHASAAIVPAAYPHRGRVEARAYAAHAATMKAVMVDSMRAARFHMTNG